LLKHRTPSRIRAGLENGPQPLSTKPVTERLQCLSDRSRMMPEVVDHFNPASFAAELLPPRNPREAVECAGDFFRRHIIKASRGRCHCGVMNIEFANERNFENVVAKFKSRTAA